MQIYFVYARCKKEICKNYLLYLGVCVFVCVCLCIKSSSGERERETHRTLLSSSTQQANRATKHGSAAQLEGTTRPQREGSHHNPPSQCLDPARVQHHTHGTAERAGGEVLAERSANDTAVSVRALDLAPNNAKPALLLLAVLLQGANLLLCALRLEDVRNALAEVKLSLIAAVDTVKLQKRSAVLLVGVRAPERHENGLGVQPKGGSARTQRKSQRKLRRCNESAANRAAKSHGIEA